MKKNYRLWNVLLLSSIASFTGCGSDGDDTFVSVHDDVTVLLGNSSEVLESSSSPVPMSSSSDFIGSSSDFQLSSVAESSNSILSSAIDYSSVAESSNSVDPESSSDVFLASSASGSLADFSLLPPPNADGTYPLVVSDEEVAKDLVYVTASADTGFQSVESVYKNLATDEKVVFVLRHARRSNDTSREGKLNAAGIAMSKKLGTMLAGEEKFSYGHTGFVRSKETGMYIAEGRGEVYPEDALELPQLLDGWYMKDEDKFNEYQAILDWRQVYSCWSYQDLYQDQVYMDSCGTEPNMYQDAFYDLSKRSVQVISQVIVPNMSKTNRVNIFISHDRFLGPLMVYASNKQNLRLRFYETGEWTFYLWGVAIIVKNNGDRKYILVDAPDYDPCDINPENESCVNK